MKFTIYPRKSDNRWGIKLEGVGAGGATYNLKVGYIHLRDARNHVVSVCREITVSIEQDIESFEKNVYPASPKGESE